MADNAAFGTLVREIVATRGGYREVSALVKINFTSIYDWGKGAVIPRAETLRKFADALEPPLPPEKRVLLFTLAGRDDPAHSDGAPAGLGEMLTQAAEEGARRALELAGIGPEQRVLTGQSGADVLLEGLYDLADRHPAVRIPLPRMNGGIRGLTVDAAEKILADMKEMIESGELGELNAMRPGRGGH